MVTDIYDNKPHLGSDEQPFTTLGYANGSGEGNGSRENLIGTDSGTKDFLQQATVMRCKETYGIQDVGKCFSGLKLLLNF